MPPRDENRETILRDIENLRAVVSDGTDIPLPAVARIHTSAVDRALRRLSEQMRVSEQDIYSERAFSAMGDIVADTAPSAASASSAIATWMDALNDAWINIGEDFEIDEEAEYQATDPLSFDELMNFGGSK